MAVGNISKISIFGTNFIIIKSTLGSSSTHLVIRLAVFLSNSGLTGTIISLSTCLYLVHLYCWNLYRPSICIDSSLQEQRQPYPDQLPSPTPPTVTMTMQKDLEKTQVEMKSSPEDISAGVQASDNRRDPFASENEDGTQYKTMTWW